MKVNLNISRRYGFSVVFLICMFAGAITHAENTHLTVGIYNNPPIVFLDEKGTPQGVYVDTLNAIAEKENWTLHYVFGQWEELLEKIKAGDIDLLTAIAYSPERSVYLDFNQEDFAQRWGVVYTLEGASVRSMADLKGRRIVLASHDIHAGFFKQAADALGVELTLLEVAGYEAVFDALKNHKADAGVVSNGYGASNAGHYGLKATTLIFKPIPLKVAFPRGQHNLISETIDIYLKQWKNESRSVYLTSYQRWLGAQRGQDRFLSLTQEQRFWLAKHKTVSVAFDGYFPPYSYLDDEGQIKGMSIDILHLLADRIGIQIEIFPAYVWQDLFNTATRTEVDVVATMVDRPERKQWFAFTRPYIHKSLVIMTRADDSTIRQREDLAGKRVALVRGYQYVPRIIQDFPTIKPVYVDTMLDGLNAVATHNADAVVTFFAAGRHLKVQYGIANLKFAAIYDRNSSLECIAVRKDWPELAAILDKALAAMKDTEIKALQLKWNSDEILLSNTISDQLSARQKEWLIFLGIFLCLVLFSLMLVITWNRTLKRKVATKTQALEKELMEHSKSKTEIIRGKKEWEATFDAMSDWVCLVDSDKRILRSNVACKDIMGFSAKDIIGQNCCKLIHGTIEPISDCPVDKVHESHRREVCEYYDLNTKRWLKVTAEPAFNEDGNIRYAIHIIQDISEQKKMESEMLQAQKMESIGTLAGGVAHDFNNILSIIVGNTELALEDTPEWNPVHANLEEIKTASFRATGIVKQLLKFSYKSSQELKPIDVIAVIKNAINFLRSVIPATIEIHTHFPDTDVTMIADPIQINQVLMNIFVNASQSMEEKGGILELTVEKTIMKEGGIKNFPDLASGEYVKLAVRDTGPGIDPGIIDRIFDPYFTTKEFGKGSGMGLAIVFGIVKNHGGAITVDSQSGKGAIFTMFFPAVDEKSVREVKVPEKMPSGNETILFVDDEESIVNMTQKMLERLGYKVEATTNPLEAWELFQLQPTKYDLVITDMTMPEMTGVTLSKKLMGLRPDIPVIICTGYSSQLNVEKELKVAACVMKPIMMSGISKIIRKVLDEAKRDTHD